MFMKIVEVYSHLNGLEFLQVHRSSQWNEIQTVIQKVNAGSCKTKVSKERTMTGRALYSPTALNQAFRKEFAQCARPWENSVYSYYVCADEKTTRRIQNLALADQKKAILDAGFEPLRTNNETDFLKDRVAVEVQFGKYSFVAHDLYVKTLVFLRG
jgi:hypothetical protein